MSRRYRILYSVEDKPEGVAREDIPKDRGACDAIVFLSMIYPEDGSFSLAIVSRDGRTGEAVTDNELWKVWAMMAERLAESSTLSGAKRDLAKTVHGIVANALQASSAEIPR